MCMCQFATMPNNNSKKLIRSGPELARTWDGVRCVAASISDGKMAVPGGCRRDGSGRWPCAGEMVVAGGRAPASTTSSEDGGFSPSSPPETRTSRYRDDSAISGIGRDYERLAGINFPRGFLVYLFCQLDGVVGGFMCKKTQHRWMAI